MVVARTPRTPDASWNPDCKAKGFLATKVQAWTRVHDKKLLRLIQYLQYSLDYRLTASCQDDPKDLRLELYVDADFGVTTRMSNQHQGGS